MALATTLRAVASKLVNQFGGDVTHRRIVVGAYNTTTGAAAETTTDTGIKGVLQDVSQREVNDLVRGTDKRLIVAAQDLNGTIPTAADRVVINSMIHQIIRVDTIEQDNTPITYELILRA